MLKIGILGTGGVGGIFGAFFADAGHLVHFIARGDNLKAIQEKGLKVVSPNKTFSIKPSAAKSNVEEMMKEVGHLDLILVCVKAWQMKDAIASLLPLKGTSTLLLPLQNGVEATELLLGVFPKEQVLRGFCAVISYIESPGVIKQVGMPPYLAFGESDHPHRTPRILSLKEELTMGGIVLETPENLLVQQWQKFLFISSLAGVTSLARLPAGPLSNQPESRAVLEDAMREVVSLGRAKGVQLPNDAVQKAMSRVDEMPFDGTTSMQRDFMDYRRTELETLCGYVVKEGLKYGISTPVHRVLYSLLLPLELKAQGSVQLH